MRILAIETSGKQGSLAALTGEPGHARQLRQIILPSEQRTAQILAPRLRSLLADVGWSPARVELVAVTIGPGSFTGLRIGVTTAKTFAYAVGAQIIGADTLEVLAMQAPPQAGILWSIIDAQRQELFVAKFELDATGQISRRSKTLIVPQDTWLSNLQAGDRVIGPALQRLSPRVPKDVVVLPGDLWQPTANTLGELAWQLYQAGQRDDMWKLVPNYYRPSAAEEKASKNK